ncbi:conjugal transfer protein TrbI [Lelliottia aquatilis]|uniref:TrbI/VirB10 family protein n=1 Tax=Lelliottia aquatilis TaxID=2080838 RepID=UPI001575B4A1|nr:TrbI/VirB10 family protein [Lelliottia aquatilis]NTZ47729.1 conjugal transfer protein TrbI [Lelliottia aquatilis]
MSKSKIRVNPSDAYLGGRISKKMLMIFGTLGALVLMVIVTVLAGKGQHSSKDTPDTANTAPAQTNNMEEDNILSSAPSTPAVSASAPPPTTQGAAQTAPVTNTGEQQNNDDEMLRQAQQRETLRLQQLKEQQFEVALSASTSIKVDLNDSDMTQKKAAAQVLPPLPGQQPAGESSPDPNGQDEKSAFSSLPHSNTYLVRGREKPVGEWELKAGAFIPSVLISGLKSDLPGQVIASVSQNVYDSRTHSQILIPQGSQLYGLYDSRIAFGQERVLMAWTRINYPDGTTLELEGMGGADTQGYAGFSDQVDHHYWKIFGNAFILGMISGVAQASINHDSGDSDSDRAESINNGVTQQFANAGSSLIQKNLDVQPTITIRNGYKFNIMLNKDIVLPPWQPAQ